MRVTLVLGAVSVLLLSQMHIEKLRPAVEEGQGELRSMPPELRRGLTFGFRNSAADFGWLDAVQYYGNTGNSAERFGSLAAILDVVTDLDPQFAYVYKFGGEAIPFRDPEGEQLWHHTRQAIALLRKGMTNLPHRWEIPWLLAYDLYTYWGEYREAGQLMLVAADDAEVKRSDERFAPPTYLRGLATRLMAQGGSLDAAIDTTRLAAERATDEQARMEIRARLDALLLDQQLQNLNALAQKQQAEGHPASSVAQLTAGSALEGLSEDPYGNPYTFDAEGHVVCPDEDKLLRLHIHPGQPAIERAVD